MEKGNTLNNMTDHYRFFSSLLRRVEKKLAIKSNEISVNVIEPWNPPDCSDYHKQF